MSQPPEDLVLLAPSCNNWPLALAQQLVANPAPWGPEVYLEERKEGGQTVLGMREREEPLQYTEFIRLAMCVSNAYQRYPESTAWAGQTLRALYAREISLQRYSTQELLDILFFCARGERFNDGLIRANEATLRKIVQEVIRRVQSRTPPRFIPAEQR